MDAKIVLPLYGLVLLAYLVLPVLGFGLVAALRRRPVRCPRDDSAARVQLDIAASCKSAVLGGTPRVAHCSLWPERAGCDRACERALTSITPARA